MGTTSKLINLRGHRGEAWGGILRTSTAHATRRAARPDTLIYVIAGFWEEVLLPKGQRPSNSSQATHLPRGVGLLRLKLCILGP